MIDENIDILLMKLWSSQPILFSHKFKVDGSQSIEKRLIILSFVSIPSPDCQCITSSINITASGFILGDLTTAEYY